MTAKSISIVDALLETGDFDPKAFAREVDEPFDISQIRASEPGFFSRQNNKMFGTRNWRVLKGNYVVGAFRRRHPGHFGEGWTERGFLVYRFARPGGGDYDLRFVGSVHDKDQLKALIAKHRQDRMTKQPHQY